MKIPFIKMQGAGNDYIYCPHPTLWTSFPKNAAELLRAEDYENIDWSALSKRLSDRHFGIGGDGLVLILPSDQADLRMRIFNADGSEAEMCGNAARCIGRYAFDHHLVSDDSFTLETNGGIRVVKKGKEDICVDMGPSLGNPHLVQIVDELTDSLVHTEGPRLEHSVEGRTNVEFVFPVSEHEIQMRVWERGSGETLACGTGACAAAMEMVKKGICSYPVHVCMPGGNLTIDYHTTPDTSTTPNTPNTPNTSTTPTTPGTPTAHILMSGPAIEVFRGEINL